VDPSGALCCLDFASMQFFSAYQSLLQKFLSIQALGFSLWFLFQVLLLEIDLFL